MSVPPALGPPPGGAGSGGIVDDALPERLRVLLIAPDGAHGAQVKRALRAVRVAEVDVEHVYGRGQAVAALATQRYDAILAALTPSEQVAAARGQGPLETLGSNGTPLVLLLDHPPQAADAARLLATAGAFLMKQEATPGALAGALEVALRQHRLRERLHAVLDASPDGMLVVDADGRVRYANAVAGQLLGQDTHALRGTVPVLPATDTAELTLGASLVSVRRTALDGAQTRGATLVTLHDVTADRAREAALRFAAEHDPLTGLANAARLHRELRAALARARRDGTRLAVLYLDLDGFKAINDVYGHETGDALLREIGTRLAATGREGEVIGRLGGDEFAMVAERLPTGAETHIAQRLLDVAARPLHAAGQPLGLSMSIGLAVAPDDGRDVETLLRAADAAMYAAKRAGRNTWRRAGEAQQAARARAALEQALRMGLLHRQFEVFYQPQFDLQTGQVEGAEALLRWNRTGEALESPATFLEVAEETGLISQLGDLVAEALCRQWVQWRWRSGRELNMALNLSAHELRAPGTFARLRSTLANHGVPARCLRVEVREDVLVRELGRVSALPEGPDGLAGLGLAVGDLSGGALSMHSLTALPVRALKLSRQLVAHCAQPGPAQAIARGVVAMAGALGLEVVAEGVETAAEMAAVRALGCQRAQGYWFSAPLAEKAFLECLDAPPRRLMPAY